MLNKPLLWFIALLTLAFAGDRIAGHFLAEMTGNSLFRYSQLYKGTAQADILLVGNSRGLAFYQPHIEEITPKITFNLSYNGMPAPLARTLVSDYLARYQPERIIIDISLCDRPNNELIAGFTTYAGQSPALQELLHQNAPDAWRGSMVSALFSYNNEVFQRALYYRNKSDKDWLIDRQIAPALAATVPLDTFPISIQADLIADLVAMVQEARNKGIEVILVLGPYYPGMVRDWSNLSAFRQAVEATTGQTVRDFSQALNDPGDFGDLMHVNKKGAVKYMDLLFR